MSHGLRENVFDVVIAGASYAGLALARALGVALDGQARIALVERRPIAEAASAPDPRAYAISAGCQRMLEGLGAWAAVSAHAQPVHGIDITDSRLEHAVRPILLSYDNHVGDGEPATWIVEAARLKPALLGVAIDIPPLTILAPSEVRAFTASDGGITLALADGGELHTHLLVACDGRMSPLREMAGIKTVAWTHDQIGIVTTVAHERPHEGRAVQHFLPGGPFAILPLPGQRSCITWTEDASLARSILKRDDAGFLAEVEQRFGHRLGALSLAGGRAGWPLEFRAARVLIARRFALAGDAARTVHPIAGQGLNLGLRDVAALAQCVAEAMRLGLDAGDITALERYARWRRFDSAVSGAAFEAINRLFSNDSTAVRIVRDVGLGLVDRLPGLKSALVSEAAGLTGEVPRLLKGEMA
jgi:2-octaprenyl-6-methoxyphenol hydroxylase